LAQATYLGKPDPKWSCRGSLDQTKYMHLTLDPTTDSVRNNGQPPAAVLISRMLQAIERYAVFTLTLPIPGTLDGFGPLSITPPRVIC